MHNTVRNWHECRHCRGGATQIFDTSKYIDEVIEVDELNKANKSAELFHTWTPKMKIIPKNEDNPKNEDDLKNEDNLKMKTPKTMKTI